MNEKNKLIRRTVTEEVFQAPDLDTEIEKDEDGQDEDDSEDDDETPKSRKHRR